MKSSDIDGHPDEGLVENDPDNLDLYTIRWVADHCDDDLFPGLALKFRHIADRIEEKRAQKQPSIRAEQVGDMLERLSVQWNALVVNRENAQLSEDAKECAKYLRYTLLGE